MQRDTNFRITSMTKPVTAVAAMDSPQPPRAMVDFWTLAYQAIDD